MGVIRRWWHRRLAASYQRMADRLDADVEDARQLSGPARIIVVHKACALRDEARAKARAYRALGTRR